MQPIFTKKNMHTYFSFTIFKYFLHDSINIIKFVKANRNKKKIPTLQKLCIL